MYIVVYASMNSLTHFSHNAVVSYLKLIPGCKYICVVMLPHITMYLSIKAVDFLKGRGLLELRLISWWSRYQVMVGGGLPDTSHLGIDNIGSLITML